MFLLGLSPEPLPYTFYIFEMMNALNALSLKLGMTSKIFIFILKNNINIKTIKNKILFNTYF